MTQYEFLFKQIDRRIRLRKTGLDPDVCNRYGAEAMRHYDAFSTGSPDLVAKAVEFARYWMPWLYAKGLLQINDLEALEERTLNDLHIVLNKKEKAEKRHDTRLLAINSHVRATGSSRVFAYNCKVDLYDESVAHLYEGSRCTAHSGWVYSFGNSETRFLGRGMIEAYDHSLVTLEGTVLAFQYDDAIIIGNTKSWVVNST